MFQVRKATYVPRFKIFSNISLICHPKGIKCCKNKFIKVTYKEVYCLLVAVLSANFTKLVSVILVHL